MAYKVTGRVPSEFLEKVLTPQALQFISELHENFENTRQTLLANRQAKQESLNQGGSLDFLPETKHIRESVWKVGPTPSDLQDRRVEITGPAERKMMINALNSGAKMFMADLEDSLSPSWDNVLQSQLNLQEAIARTLTFTSPEGKVYKLNSQIATLLVRPRGWHLNEENFDVNGAPISASLFDFGLTFFHNAKELIKRGSGPYFYLPKLESHLEARLWNDVFKFAQTKLSIPQGTIRATVLIETIPAAFEMDEILYELKDHIAGLNAGRWDYIFSCIKKFAKSDKAVFPDRTQVSMAVPFMRAYTELLVKTCHHRGAHAMGGMAAFIPSRKDAKVNEVALSKVREDKLREAKDGFDGTWVAHPDLVSVAQEIFDKVLGGKPHQKQNMRAEVKVSGPELTNFQIPGGSITERGFRNNISVALQYVESWMRGLGAVGIYNLMEDAATAEISRAELWQWIHRGANLDDGRAITQELYRSIRDEELTKLGGLEKGRYRQTVEVLDGLVLNESFSDFLTIKAYRYL